MAEKAMASMEKPTIEQLYNQSNGGTPSGNRQHEARRLIEPVIDGIKAGILNDNWENFTGSMHALAKLKPLSADAPKLMRNCFWLNKLFDKGVLDRKGIVKEDMDKVDISEPLGVLVDYLVDEELKVNSFLRGLVTMSGRITRSDTHYGEYNSTPEQEALQLIG